MPCGVSGVDASGWLNGLLPWHVGLRNSFACCTFVLTMAHGNRHNMFSEEWRKYHTRGTWQYLLRKPIWFLDRKIEMYKRYRSRRGIIRGTLLSKNGVRAFNDWLFYMPPYGEFTVDISKMDSDLYRLKDTQITDLIEFALIREGFAEKKENGRYEFTERGIKLIRHGSLKKLLRQELNEDRANAARNRKDILWWVVGSSAFLLGIVFQFLLAILEAHLRSNNHK